VDKINCKIFKKHNNTPAALTGSFKTGNAVPSPLAKLKFAEKIPVENLETSNTKFDNSILDVLNG
jgi:hypothetical protein